MLMQDPERVLVVGDLHGSTASAIGVIRYAAENNCDAIVQVGDYGWWTPGRERDHYLSEQQKLLEECDLTLFWLRGNHEYHPDIFQRLNGPTAQPLSMDYPRIVYLPDGCRWEWSGKTWMALGGAVSVDRLWRSSKSWWPEEVLTDEDVEYASRPGDVDIVVAHDCPWGVDIPGLGGNWPPMVLAEADEHRRKVRKVFDAVRPTMYIHGHYHQSYWGALDHAEGRCAVRGLDCDGSPKRMHVMIVGSED